MKQGNFIKLNDTRNRKWEIEIKDSARKVLKTLKLDEFEKVAAEILGGIEMCPDGDLYPSHTYFYYGFYVNFIFYDEDNDLYCCNLHNGNHGSHYTLDQRYYLLLKNFNVNIDQFKMGLYKNDYASIVRQTMRYKRIAEFHSWHPIFCLDDDIDKVHTIGRINCFGNSTHSNLIALFNHMVKVFGWTRDVRYIINTHSVFGRAYVNAMEASALRFYNVDPIYATPSEDIILSHFKKLLIREQYNGSHIDIRIRKKYMMN